jgi:hypothetical protein
MAILSLGYQNTTMADAELRFRTEVKDLPGEGHIATGLILAIKAIDPAAAGPAGRYELKLTVPEALGVAYRAACDALTGELGEKRHLLNAAGTFRALADAIDAGTVPKPRYAPGWD